MTQPQEHTVWESAKPERFRSLFSDGITREFGENKNVVLNSGDIVMAEVQPLRCDPVEFGLVRIGKIFV